MNREFTQRLRDLAKRTSFRAAKDKINAYFTLHEEVDINDASQAVFLMEALKPFMAKDKEIYAFCKAFENRQALATLGVSAALTEIQKTKVYSVNDKIKNRVDELIQMKNQGVPEIKIFEAYKNEVQGLVLDNFFNKYMSDTETKANQLRAYAFVDEALEQLSKDPNPELLDDVFQKLEGSMSLPAAQVPFYLIKALTPNQHLSPVIRQLLTQLKAIDPLSQRNTMNQIRYVGSAGIYESVLAPVKFGESADLVMLGNRLFNISEASVEEPEEGTVDEAFVDVCRAFAQTRISESGAIEVSDDDDNKIEIDESAEGGLVLTLNKNITIPVDEAKGWQTELLGMQVHPGVIGIIQKITENLESIVSMDNIMSLSSPTGNGYAMYLIKQGKANHMVITEPSTGGVAIQKKITVKEAVEAAMEAFGADISKFFGEEKPANENADCEAKMKEIQEQIDQCDASMAEINGESEEVRADEEVQGLMKELEAQKAELMSQYEQLAGQLDVAK